MSRRRNIAPDFPTGEQLKAELNRVRYKSRFRSILMSTIYGLIVVAAVVVLIAVLWMPVLRMQGTSMEPTLQEDDIVVSVKGTNFEPGDLICFYIGNKLLVKRFIAGPGQWVKIDDAGNVYVDDVLLEEPYITQKALGDCNIEFPHQVPQNRVFCLGDHRDVSADSRNSAVGDIAYEQIVGRLILRIWPLSSFGFLEPAE